MAPLITSSVGIFVVCFPFVLSDYLPLFPSAHRFPDGRSARATDVASVQTKEYGWLKSPRRHTLRSTAALVFLAALNFKFFFPLISFSFFCGSFWLFG